MKKSKYNVVFPYENHKVHYNTLYSMLADLLLKTPAVIESVHPQFYNVLIEGYFIVDENLDEVNAVENL